MTTPAQDKGIAVGQVVRMIKTETRIFCEGVLIRLKSDDRSPCPLFELVDNPSKTRYVNLDSIDSTAIRQPKFKVGQVVEVAASGWGLAPAMIGKTCTVASVSVHSDRITYKVEGLGEAGTDLVSNDIWEESFKAVGVVPTPAQRLTIDPSNLVQINFPTLEIRTVNTIQSQALATFNTMRNRAIAHRNGESQSDSLFYTGYGICDNIHRCMPDGASSDTMALIKDNLIRRVPSYSGNYHYPVNHPKGGSTQKERSQAADNAWSEFNNKWGGEYGALRLAQLEELIEHIENKWDDSLAKEMTPATRVGLVVGVSLVEYRDGTIWRFVRDDKSADPYFESVSTSNQTSLDLRYVTILQMEEDTKKRSVAQFLKEIARQAAKRDKLQAQIAELQKQAAEASQRIAMLDYGLGNAHKVQRMTK